MKTLICAHDRPNYINGPNMWLQRVLPGLREQGIDSKLLFFPAGDPAKCNTIQALKNDGFECVSYTGKKYTEYRIKWILEHITTDPPDVFIPNLDIPAYHASRLVKHAGIPTVGILHSDDPFYHAIIEEFIDNQPDQVLTAVVCVSQYLEEHCLKRTAGQKIRIEKIPYGVPVPEDKAGYSDDKLKLLYAGRLEEKQKRISDVTRSLCRLVKEVPGTEAVLYGSGTSEEKIRSIIRQNDAERKVKLGGLVDSRELQSKLLESQVFILLSDYEGLPIALMEAMACGLVPVCYDMESGIPELVEHNKTGLIVKDRADDFIKAVKQLKQDKKKWNSLSEAVRAKIENGYSTSYSVSRWASLLKELKNGRVENPAIDIPDFIELPDKHVDISSYQDPRWQGAIGYYKGRLKNIYRKIVS